MSTPRCMFLFALIAMFGLGGCIPGATGPPFAAVDVKGTGKAVVYLYMTDWSDGHWDIYANQTWITQLVTRLLSLCD